MSANPRFYKDSSLLDEVTKTEDGKYEFRIGSEFGIDGNIGETVIEQFWLHNDGDEIYQEVVLTEEGDITPSRVSYSTDGLIYDEKTLHFGNIGVGETKTLYIKVEVEPGAGRGRQNLTFTLTGESI